jgi:hypothetical protein
MNEIVYFDFVSLYAGVRQKQMSLSEALDFARGMRKTKYQWAIHRKRDGILLAETKGMKQAVIDAFKSGAMS